MLKHIKTEYKNQEPRNVAWGQMRALIAGRSEDTVKRMEAERGLV